MSLTLERLLKLTVGEKGKETSPEFKVTVKGTFDRGVRFIIHPAISDADTVTKEFMVSDNILTDLSK